MTPVTIEERVRGTEDGVANVRELLTEMKIDIKKILSTQEKQQEFIFYTVPKLRGQVKLRVAQALKLHNEGCPGRKVAAADAQPVPWPAVFKGIFAMGVSLAVAYAGLSAGGSAAKIQEVPKLVLSAPSVVPATKSE